MSGHPPSDLPFDALREQLAREDAARNPQTPEQWYRHAVESMGAIGEIERGQHGSNLTQDYRTFLLKVPEGTGLYIDTPQDNYEVRVQRDARYTDQVVEDEAYSLDDLLSGRVSDPLVQGSQIDQIIKGVHAVQADSPEFIWRDHTAHIVTVQRHNSEVPLSTLPPAELEEHAQFLRRAAIIHAATYGNREVLASLLEREPDIHPQVPGD